MIYKFALLSFTVLLVVSSRTLAADIPQDTIRIEKSFPNNTYYIGSQSFSRSELVDILYKNPASEDLANASSWGKNIGYLLIGSGLVFTAISLNDIYETHLNEGAFPSSNTFYITSLLAIASEFIGIITLLDSKSNFYKAVKLYNSNILNPNHTGSIELNLNIGINKVMLSLKF
ncbi:MAG: hypothetical protein HYZ54_13090 [Ignavibacteriae bacterium]|nr:hypothetical protein [Ignavibacteriota bacterium]